MKKRAAPRLPMEAVLRLAKSKPQSSPKGGKGYSRKVKHKKGEE